MALTSAEVDVCNLALGRIGSWVLDYSDTTGTGQSGMAGNVANKCLIHYEQTRDTLLRSAYWNFASTRISLVSDWSTDTSYTTDHYIWKDSILYKCGTAHRSTTFEDGYVYFGDDMVYSTSDLIFDEDYLIKWGTSYWDIVLDRCLFEYTYKYRVPADFMRMKPKYFEDECIEARLEGNYILTDETALDIKYIKKVTDTSEFDDLFMNVLVLDLAMRLLYPLAGTKSQDLKAELQKDRNDAMKRARAVCSSENKKLNTTRWVDARYGTGVI